MQGLSFLNKITPFPKATASSTSPLANLRPFKSICDGPNSDNPMQLRPDRMCGVAEVQISAL